MDNTKEILKELRQIRMQIALTPFGVERDNLTLKADKLHKSYAKSLFKEKTLERKRGNNND